MLRNKWKDANHRAYMQLPRLVDSHKLRSEAQRVLTRTRQGRRQLAEGMPGDSELVAALLTWCQAVCGAHGMAIHNFTTSFADARGLCWLVSSPASNISAILQSMTPIRSVELTLVGNTSMLKCWGGVWEW